MPVQEAHEIFTHLPSSSTRGRIDSKGEFERADSHGRVMWARHLERGQPKAFFMKPDGVTGMPFARGAKPQPCGSGLWFLQEIEMGKHLIATWLRFAREEISVRDVCYEYDVGTAGAERLLQIGRRAAIESGALIA